MKNLASEQNIIVCWFYGEPGHCKKGTIDAMSSFGCKTPMRKEIVSKDAWFGDAETMVEFLNEHFENDDTKNHFLVDAEKMSEIRKKELNIKGSRKMLLTLLEHSSQ